MDEPARDRDLADVMLRASRALAELRAAIEALPVGHPRRALLLVNAESAELLIRDLGTVARLGP